MREADFIRRFDMKFYIPESLALSFLPVWEILMPNGGAQMEQNTSIVVQTGWSCRLSHNL